MPFGKIFIVVNTINLKKNEFYIFNNYNLIYCVYLGNITIIKIMNIFTTQKSISQPSPSPFIAQLAEIIFALPKQKPWLPREKIFKCWSWQHCILSIGWRVAARVGSSSRWLPRVLQFCASPRQPDSQPQVSLMRAQGVGIPEPLSASSVTASGRGGAGTLCFKDLTHLWNLFSHLGLQFLFLGSQQPSVLRQPQHSTLSPPLSASTVLCLPGPHS